MDTISEALSAAENIISAEDLDLDYITECIHEQVDELMESSSKKNYFKTFENKIDNCDLNDSEKINVREAMYSDIIDIISEKFNITVNKESVSNRELAKNLYKFFIINYNDNVEQFLEMYILENKKDIIDELERREINAKRVEGISSKKIATILNNISFVIDIIANSGIDFLDFLQYIDKHPESSSSTGELIDFMMDESIENADEVITFIMDQLVNEEEGFGNIYTELQRRLFDRFSTLNK